MTGQASAQLATCHPIDSLDVSQELLVVMPFAPSSDALVTSSYLLLVVRPGATSSVLAKMLSSKTCIHSSVC